MTPENPPPRDDPPAREEKRPGWPLRALVFLGFLAAALALFQWAAWPERDSDLGRASASQPIGGPPPQITDLSRSGDVVRMAYVFEGLGPQSEMYQYPWEGLHACFDMHLEFEDSAGVG